MPPGTTNKLLNLLYDQTVEVSRTATPLIKNRLYDKPLESPVLDGLMGQTWSKLQLHKAPSLVKSSVKSNILMFKTTMPFLTRNDFYDIYPIARERVFSLPPEMKNGLKFHPVKARNPLTLSFKNAYYLIFPNHAHAAAYVTEVKNKLINGVPLRFEFKMPDTNTLLNISVPVLESEYRLDAKVDPLGLFSLEKSQLIKQIPSQEIDDNFEDMSKLIDFETRASSVLVRNLPIGLSKHALPRLLWDYEFPKDTPISKCFIQIERDLKSQVNIMVIRFANHENAERFTRSFHGTKWQGFTTDKSKMHRLYEPISCEILI